LLLRANSKDFAARQIKRQSILVAFVGNFQKISLAEHMYKIQSIGVSFVPEFPNFSLRGRSKYSQF
jgi:hypothetical protein